MKLILSFWLVMSIMAVQPSHAVVMVGFGQSAEETTISDDFNRSDGPLGTNWTTITAGTMGVGVIEILSNMARGTVYQVYSMAYYNAAMFAADQYAQIIIGAAVAPDYTGIGVRLDSAGNGYAVRAITTTVVQVVKLTAGVPTAMGSNFAVGDVRGLVFRLEAAGTSTTTLSVYLNGTLLGTRADSTSPYTSGAPGLVLRGTKDVDDFEAGDL